MNFARSLQLSLRVLTTLSAPLRRKTIQLRALRLKRHVREAEKDIQQDLLRIAPIRRFGRALPDPLQLPNMEEPDY